MEKLTGTPTPKPVRPAEGESTHAQPSSTPPKIVKSNEAAPKPKININKAPPASTIENPFAQLTSKTSPSGTTVRTGEKELSKRPRAELDEIQARTQAAPPAKRTAMAPAKEEPAEYENRILSHIFRVTLDPNEKVDTAGHRLIYMPNLRAELEEENASIMLTKERLDSAILEACSTISNKKSVLDYLLPCWKRTMRAARGPRVSVTGRDEILNEAKRLCMSNCIFALEMPELYGSVLTGKLVYDADTIIVENQTTKQILCFLICCLRLEKTEV
jgi:ubiquitin conjugation factor E4 B